MTRSSLTAGQLDIPNQDERQNLRALNRRFIGSRGVAHFPNTIESPVNFDGKQFVYSQRIGPIMLSIRSRSYKKVL